MHVFPERSRCGFDDVRLHDGFLHFGRRAGGRHLEANDDYLTWLRRQPGQDPHADYFDDGLGCNSQLAMPWSRDEYLHPTNWVVHETLDWLQRRDPTVPFFSYVSFHRPHAPFNPPQWAWDQYINRPRVDPPRGEWASAFEEFREDNYHQTKFGRLDPETHHRTVTGYYGLITHIDMQLNRLLEGLADYELLDDTVIIFTSDHGDMMGDHDMYRKSVGFEGSANVPLIVRPAPRFAGDAPRGQVITEVTELRDIMPTVLDFAGVDVPDSVDGASLVPFATGRTRAGDLAARDPRRAHPLRPVPAVGHRRQTEVSLGLAEGDRAVLRPGGRPAGAAQPDRRPDPVGRDRRLARPLDQLPGRPGRGLRRRR